MRFRRHLAACALALVVVLVVGYLTVQTVGYAGGYLVGLDGLPSIAVARRFAWELDLGMILFGIAAVAAYRKIAVSKGIEVTVLVTLVVSFLVSGSFLSSAHSVPIMPAGPGGLIVWSFVSGGSSPFTLALIACVAATLLLKHRTGTRGATDETPSADRGTHAGSSS